MNAAQYHDELRVLKYLNGHRPPSLAALAAALRLPERKAALRLEGLAHMGCLEWDGECPVLTLVGRAVLADRAEALTRGEAPKLPKRRRTSKVGELDDPEARGQVGLPYTVGSDTSREAAEGSLRTAEIVRRKVYRLLADAGERGMADFELEAALPMYAESGVRTRRDELVKDGLVEDSGLRRPNVRQKPCAVWRLVAADIQEAS